MYCTTLFFSLLFNFLEVTRGIQSPSYHAESDLIISSIKPEISLKINASFKLYALHFGAAKNKEEQERIGLMLWFCMDFVISWSSLSYLTSLSAPLSCSSWSRHCDVQVIIFLPPLGATLGSTSFVSPEAPSFCLCCCYQTARSCGRGQRAGSLSLCPPNHVLQRNVPWSITQQIAAATVSEDIISQKKKSTATQKLKEK